MINNSAKVTTVDRYERKWEIGNNVDIAGGSGVIKDIPDNSRVMGYPAKNLREFLRENK